MGGNVKRYAIHDVFATYQGEGVYMGRAAVFVRFAGCNLWGGLATPRTGKGACAKWCDTDFRPRVQLELEPLVDRVRALHKPGSIIVLTGGEPLLQVDSWLASALLDITPNVCLETNGTVEKTCGHKLWVAVSPKLSETTGQPLPVLVDADEVKVVVPGATPPAGWTPELLAGVEASSWARGATLWLHAQDPSVSGAGVMESHLARCVELAEARPAWRLGVQAHKVWRLP